MLTLISMPILMLRLNGFFFDLIEVTTIAIDKTKILRQIKATIALPSLDHVWRREKNLPKFTSLHCQRRGCSNSLETLPRKTLLHMWRFCGKNDVLIKTAQENDVRRYPERDAVDSRTNNDTDDDTDHRVLCWSWVKLFCTPQRVNFLFRNFVHNFL